MTMTAEDPTPQTFGIHMFVPRRVVNEAPILAVEAFLDHMRYQMKFHRVLPVAPWTMKAIQPATLGLPDGTTVRLFDEASDDPFALPDGVMLVGEVLAIPLPPPQPKPIYGGLYS